MVDDLADKQLRLRTVPLLLPHALLAREAEGYSPIIFLYLSKYTLISTSKALKNSFVQVVYKLHSLVRSNQVKSLAGFC